MTDALDDILDRANREMAANPYMKYADALRSACEEVARRCRDLAFKRSCGCGAEKTIERAFPTAFEGKE